MKKAVKEPSPVMKNIGKESTESGRQSDLKKSQPLKEKDAHVETDSESKEEPSFSPDENLGQTNEEVLVQGTDD